MTTIASFINRLKKIGITVELDGNIPWIYLRKVNGIPVKVKYESEHGFTAFWYSKSQPEITHVGKIFEQIRLILNYDKALKNENILSIIKYGKIYHPIWDGGKYRDENYATGEIKHFPDVVTDHILEEKDGYEISWIHLGLGYYKQTRKTPIYKDEENI